MAPDNRDSLIQWLEVRNFRGIEHVRLEGLGRVNLIVGKNGIGKTSLLEAIRFYVTGGEPSALLDTLVGRDETLNLPVGASETIDPGSSPLLSLLPGRPQLAEVMSRIAVCSNLGVLNAWIKWKSDNPVFVLDGEAARVTSLDWALRRLARLPPPPLQPLPDSCLFVGTNGVRPEEWAAMWDAIVLTDTEDELIKSVRFLTPGIERLSLIGSGNRAIRIPMAKVSGFSSPVPFKSLGDGVNRALGLLVALASVRGGVLLVDEIENGIHYSAQDGLWRLLIDAAVRFNVQIFATTHSSDCIRAFQRATAAVPGPTGVLTRLEQRKGKIVATQFDEDELRIAGTESIEVR